MVSLWDEMVGLSDSYPGQIHGPIQQAESTQKADHFHGSVSELA